jgi:tetratricopeptide (TPR) repeat protein
VWQGDQQLRRATKKDRATIDDMIMGHPEDDLKLVFGVETKASLAVQHGVAYLQANEAHSAIEIFTFAIEQDPDLAAAYAGRSQAYGLLGKRANSLADQQKARELDPALQVVAESRSQQPQQLPDTTGMDDQQFWSMIETAWEIVPGSAKLRKKLAEGKLSEGKAHQLEEALDEVMPALKEQLDKLTADDLLAFDRTLERKLFDIDRAEIQEQTDGSDDGFLYCRGFIVAAGKSYYDSVNKNPSVALMDLECQEMCYLSWHLYHDKFGEMPPSGISRETCSNTEGWPDDA